MTEALVHLLPLPKVRGIVVLHFDSMANAVASVGAILACEPSAAELLDGLILRLAEKSLEYRNYLDFVVGQPESLVLVEFNGEHADEVQRQGRRAASSGCAGQPGLFHILPALEQAAVRSHLGLSQGGAAAAAGPARHAQAGGLRRRRARSRPSTCRSSSRGFARSWPGTTPTARFTATPRSAACTFGRCSTCASRSTSTACEQISQRSVRPGAWSSTAR